MLFASVGRDIRYAFRSFRRAPLAASTIVMTVGLGLGLVAAVFTLLNAIVFRADDVRDPQELFAIGRQPSPDAEPATFTRAEYETFARDTDVFSEAFATTPQFDAWIEGFRLEGYAVTGNFFRVLGVAAARGRTIAAPDDEPGRPPVIVLSHRAWAHYFASDPAVLHRTVRVNGTAFHVAGVTPEGFRGLELVAAPDFWVPLSAAGLLRPGGVAQDGRADLTIVGRLKTGLSREQALAQLLVWDSQRMRVRRAEPSAARLVLEPRQGTVPLSAETLLLFLPLFFAFGLILLIGCANVANLLLARGVARQREIGVRLAIGASRRRVVWQLLTESLLLACACAALAFGISRLVLVAAVHVVTSTFPPEIGSLRIVVPAADWRVAVFLAAGALLSTLVFALAPALQATRVELVRAMRGEVVRDLRPGRARDALVALQVTGSVLLLICAAVFLRSTLAAAAVDPGIRTASIVTVQVANEQRRAAILDVVRREPSVAAVAATWPSVLGGLGWIPATAEGAGGKSRVTYQFVSPEYFGVFGIDLVRGRGFTPAERSPDAAVAVVSDSVARLLWPGLDAVGQLLRLEPHAPATPDTYGSSAMKVADSSRRLARTAVVVGVARDVAGFRLGGARFGGAGVYLPIDADAGATALAVRVHGDAARVRLALAERMAAIDPNMGEVSTMQTIARMEAYLLAIPFWLTLVLGALALLLTLSGLFGVLSYLVEQRTREIGVRIALGATTRSVATLVLGQAARPVALGLVVGSSFTAALAAVLLWTPAAAQIGSSVQLFDPVAYGAALVWIVVACAGAALVPVVRATRLDPVGALRQE